MQRVLCVHVCACVRAVLLEVLEFHEKFSDKRSASEENLDLDFPVSRERFLPG